MRRRDLIRRVPPGLLALGLSALPARAHHGWRWVSPEEFELTGTIVAVRLGNPHGLVTLDVGGEQWIGELGQPWRHARAGLPEALLVPGATITLRGHRSADPAERRMKAERVILAGRSYDLYPDRD